MTRADLIAKALTDEVLRAAYNARNDAYDSEIIDVRDMPEVARKKGQAAMRRVLSAHLAQTLPPFAPPVPDETGYNLTLYQCDQCDQVWPMTHAPDCPKTRPAEAAPRPEPPAPSRCTCGCIAPDDSSLHWANCGVFKVAGEETPRG